MTERYRLELEPLPGWPDRNEPIPAEVRLRLALKVLLRRHGLRCLDARVIPATESIGAAEQGVGRAT